VRIRLPHEILHLPSHLLCRLIPKHLHRPYLFTPQFLTWTSNMRTGLTSMVKSPRTCTSSASNTWSGLPMYFLNCETWNTLCKLARWGGKSISYVFVPIFRVIWYGPINLEVNFLDLRTLPIHVVGVTQRNTWSPSSNSNGRLLLST